MDQLGGLAKRMRWTTALFLIGAMGLAGISPMNGFQSEWLGLQTLIRAHDLASVGDRVYLAAAGALLTLTFALAMTTYPHRGRKLSGGPRSGAARDASRSAPRHARGNGDSARRGGVHGDVATARRRASRLSRRVALVQGGSLSMYLLYLLVVFVVVLLLR